MTDYAIISECLEWSLKPDWSRDMPKDASPSKIFEDVTNDLGSSSKYWNNINREIDTANQGSGDLAIEGIDRIAALAEWLKT